ncbi:MAG: diaminopimelate decarboxylase [Hadesarchaea archaeon]|nr:MAG: diaminopimelate decarboxylase [Hadesarchaea archaeon]TDA34112.1 MAG: diaminopimelate decarboxylase [Hadesarchaea archaeon]
MLMLKPHFRVNSYGHLVCGGIDTVELCEEFGTPLYVMDEERIRDNYRRFLKAFSKRRKVRLCYALKANSNSAVVRVLATEGAGADVSSENELRIALRAGIPGEKMVFNGNLKTQEELRLALKHGVTINIDNFQELEVVERLAGKMKTEARISFRINPNIRAPTHPYIATGLRESKFGFDVESGEALEAYRRARQMKNLKIVGIHAHIGSQILDPSPFVEEAEKVMEVVAKLHGMGIELDFVDLGGGVGIPYRPEEREMNLEELAEKVVSVVKRVEEEKGMEEHLLVFEPGRYIVGDAGILLARVEYTKERKGLPRWISLDAGMNALIRPALYGAYHHIELANKMDQKNDTLTNVAGPLCESGDFLGKERLLPKAERGDLAVIFDVGAYGLSMSNQHTAKPRPAMVMVKGGKAALVRKRETFRDLVRLDLLPPWLK